MAVVLGTWQELPLARSELLLPWPVMVQRYLKVCLRLGALVVVPQVLLQLEVSVGSLDLRMVSRCSVAERFQASRLLLDQQSGLVELEEEVAVAAPDSGLSPGMD